ncbi:MAG: hypothetical protein A2V91_06350 [Candidatus Muproteobacteria bacterium RBG_16_64_10]|uniref:peptidylprolyl isomerase n=1 Tax=Candidatus Muproteobacteria bacterium RBG_16_64_10 TaxID=1817757 RepID=A0A1F6T721_9PROT|nr:MAG: hypothetical protein A2V91_06350 [Candidatus Muproteobacteria bacterium RBG_16_64_10]
MIWLMRTLLLLAICLAPVVAAVGEQQPAGLPEVVARVNNTAITRAELETRLAQSRSMNPALFDTMPPPERQRATLRVLNDMVIRELEVQEARRRGFAVADAEIERELAGLRQRFPDEAALVKNLAEHKITLAQWREETRRNLLIAKLEQTILAGIPVTDEEIRKEYTQNFWRGKGEPPAKELAEHREHMLAVIRQRKWTGARRVWRDALIATATIWRWTPAPPTDAEQK